MNIGTWLLSLIEPFTARVLASLGFSVVTVGGIQGILQTVKDQFIGTVNSMPADVINLFLLAGGGQAIGIVMGALTTKFLHWQVTSSVRILGYNPG